MGRSGYNDNDDIDNWDLIRWRGAVNSAIKGKRGQTFLREMLASLDALPSKSLIAEELHADGEVCALGAVGLARGIDMSKVDPEDRETVAGLFDIPFSMAAEIMYENDESGAYWRKETPEDRYARMRKWVEGHLKSTQP